jgi:hypothetical protein
MRHIAGGEVDVGGCVRPHEGGGDVRGRLLAGDLDRDGNVQLEGKATKQS